MVMLLSRHKLHQKRQTASNNEDHVYVAKPPKSEPLIINTPKPLELPMNTPKIADNGELIFNERVIFNNKSFVSNDFVINERLFVKGKSIIDNAIIKENLQVKGNIKGLTIANFYDTIIRNNLNVTNNTKLNSAIIEDELTVNGNTILNNKLLVNNIADIKGELHVSGSITAPDLNVETINYIKKNIIVSDDNLNINGNLEVYGNTNINNK